MKIKTNFKKYFNKKGQGTLEFGLCALTFMLLTLGMFDMAKLGITYIENNFNLSDAVSRTVQDSANKNSIKYQINEIMKQNTKNNFFCTDYLGSTNCDQRTSRDGDNEVVVEPLKITNMDVSYKVAKDAKKGNGLPAGTVICAEITMKYKVAYSQLLNTQDLEIKNTSCNVLEYSGANPNSAGKELSD